MGKQHGCLHTNIIPFLSMLLKVSHQHPRQAQRERHGPFQNMLQAVRMFVIHSKNTAEAALQLVWERKVIANHDSTT